MKDGILYIFSGLPGSGKSTLASLLSKKLGIAYLRVDTIEQGLRDICLIQNIYGEGYRLMYQLARENLSLGNSVIVDSVNPLEITRKEFIRVAVDEGVHFRNIEIACSDPEEHKRRIEGRTSAVFGLKLPTWDEVCNREYHPWTGERVYLDTSGKTIDASFEELLNLLTT